VPSFRLLADLNVSPLTVAVLRQHGWDVVRSSDLLPATAPDPEILALAGDQDRVLLTQDLDFSVLLALSGRERPSLITLRLSDSAPDVVTQRLIELELSLERALATSCAVTVEDEKIRIRKLPIL
jgi:predicted nuclease of predicted toxin-antitoxin system